MAHQAHEGRLIGGRYRLVKTLHTGGFGRVWQARDERGHDDVAVKEVWLPPGLSAAERTDRLVRADREARNAARLRNHPNIVAVRDVVTEDGAPWIVMRLVTGHSLAQDIAASGPLSAAQVVYVADSLLKALGAAHEAGIVHRDVKPANVLFTETGEVLLTDFGIAVHEADTTLTATGMLVGSVEYIAPERIHGRDTAAAGDMFSLGVTLYQAVTGVSPFHRDTAPASFAAILFVDPPPPRCAPALSSLIMRLLAKDPAQRPTVPVARGLLAALAASAPAKPKPTLVSTRPAPAPSRPAPRHTAREQPAPGQPAPRPPVARRPAPVRLAPAPRTLRRPMRWRRGRRVWVVVLVAVGFVAFHTAWGRDAGAATVGDCVYDVHGDWHLEPCALPPPWRNTAGYQVLDRVDGVRADCAATAYWTPGDTAVTLPGRPPVTLCLAPVH